MRITTLIATAVTLLWTALALSATASLELYSSYVWRGMDLSKGAAVIQTSLSDSKGPFELAFWGNYDTGTSDWTETDISVFYSVLKSPVALGLGVVYYSLEGDDSAEVVVSAEKQLPFGASVSLSVYKEFSHFPAWWFELGGSLSKEVISGVSAVLSLSLLYLVSEDPDAYASPDDPSEEFSGPFAGTLSLKLERSLRKGVTTSLLLNYSFPLGTDAEKAIEDISLDGKADHFFGGLGLSLEF